MNDVHKQFGGSADHHGQGGRTMFDLFSTLIRGANARATDKAVDHFAIDLINQKIRDADAGVNAAKQALAALILRQRHEQRALEQLTARQAQLEDRVRAALASGREDLAEDGAAAVADLENEATTRKETLDRLGERVARLRLSVEKAHRRVADLRQGAVAAHAMDLERRSQARINRSLNAGNAMHDAETLIKRVTDQADPLAEAEVLEEIDRSVSHRTTEDRLAEAGFGPSSRVSTGDVLSRLRQPK